MQGALAGTPVTDFPNVVPLEQQAGEHHINVDTPDTAPTEDEPATPKEKPPARTESTGATLPPSKPPPAQAAGSNGTANQNVSRPPHR